MGQCAPEDSISQCPFLQMIDTAGNPHADGSATPGARPRHRPSSHRNPPATSRSHDNWMAARQTSCRQQTAPPQPRCSKDVTAHPHRPGARPGRPCQVPARSGQPLSGRSGFSPAFGTEFFICTMHEADDDTLQRMPLRAHRRRQSKQPPAGTAPGGPRGRRAPSAAHRRSRSKQPPAGTAPGGPGAERGFF